MKLMASALAIGVAVVGLSLAYPRVFTAAEAGAPAAFPEATDDEPLAPQPGRETIVVAGGCFWGGQAVFQHTHGVPTSTSGDAGGTTKNPSYQMVNSGMTGQAPSVQGADAPSQSSLGPLLQAFF